MKSIIFKLALIMLFLNSSCDKWLNDKLSQYKPDCKSGDCIKANIKGTVYEKPSGDGIKNVPVEVFFVLKGKWIIPDDKKVVRGKTDNDGVFDFNVTIDKKTFETHGLRVRIPEQKDYITLSAKYGFIDRDFDGYNEEALKNIRFEFYKKATLTINLNRTQTDDFEDFWVYYSYDNKFSLSGFVFRKNSQSATNETKQIEVRADIYTKFLWQKYIGDKEYTFQDSLICLQNANNVFNINY